jgi:hypothetical protein
MDDLATNGERALYTCQNEMREAVTARDVRALRWWYRDG